METRALGRQRPEISVVGYGAWEAGGDMWGPSRPDDEIIAAMHAALDAGMSWIDTAEVYGGGRSEELVGQAVRDRRDEVLIFTKIAYFASGARRDEVRSAIHGSLRRLGTEWVDLYQVHWPTERVPIEETWGAMAELVDEGLVRHIGVSNFNRELIERCLPIRHVDSVQNQFSLLQQRDRAELLPWLQAQGIGYLAYGPLAFGLLTGAITETTTFPDEDWRSGKRNIGYYDHLFAPGVRGKHLERVERLRSIADRLGVPLPTLALRAAIDVPGVTAAIAGSTNPRHVRSNAAAGDLTLDAAVREEIDRIFA